MISIVKYLFESQAWERKSYDKSVVHGNSRPTMGNNFTHNFQKEKAVILIFFLLFGVFYYKLYYEFS